MHGTRNSQVLVARTGLFAGLPAPTGITQNSSLWRSCGSGQAREEAGTAKPPSSHPTKPCHKRMMMNSFLGTRARPAPPSL
ncbi:hypothetical protein C6A77_03285 [Pseudomonas sp. AFG_SD02_1510_Pfu_092]|nr:hypothetical protein C6A77_03285 [Pseudomonas sp. AFG_SD02_1510_Pfu_092]